MISVFSFSFEIRTLFNFKKKKEEEEEENTEFHYAIWLGPFFSPIIL